jgi:hypothetical protein
MSAEPRPIRRVPSAAGGYRIVGHHLDRLALAIDRAGKRGAMYLPIYERIEAKLEELRAKEARVERARHRLK